jgi:mannose-1-phosphate guanylyltransferase
MRALLLAGGFGSRLRPLTDYVPKCLAPIGGRPLLDHWLELLLHKGIDRVLVNTHYLAPMVRDFLEGSAWADRVTIVQEDTLLGTGGTVLANRAFFGDAPFLVAHADNLSVFDPIDFAARHALRPDGVELTMMVFETPDPSSCGIVELDARGVVQAFHEKVHSPPGNLANAAVYIFEPALLQFLAGLGKREIDLSREVIPHYLGRMLAYRNGVYHRDIGTMASWLQAQRDFPSSHMEAKSALAWNRLLRSDNCRLARSIQRLAVDPPGPRSGR